MEGADTAIVLGEGDIQCPMLGVFNPPMLTNRLGKLCLTDTGLFRREMQVLSTCVAYGTAIACVIGGGYADDLQALVYRHSLLHRAASDVYRQFRL